MPLERLFTLLPGLATPLLRLKARLRAPAASLGGLIRPLPQHRLVLSVLVLPLKGLFSPALQLNVVFRSLLAGLKRLGEPVVPLAEGEMHPEPPQAEEDGPLFTRCRAERRLGPAAARVSVIHRPLADPVTAVRVPHFPSWMPRFPHPLPQKPNADPLGSALVSP